MRITSAGNVLIGTTGVENPRGLAQALEIEAGSPVGIILNDSRDTHPMGIENAGAVMNFTYNTSPLMTIIGSSGNVGIGTTTFASTSNLQLKMGNMGSGIVGEIFDAVDNADNSRIIVCGGGTGTPQFSMRHYSAGYGIDMWLNTSSPWDTYIDNRNAASGFIFRNNCNNDGGEDELMRITGSGNVGIGGSPTVSFEIAKAGARMKMIDGTNQLNMGLWDGANYRFEGDANRPMFFTSYQGNINFGISGGTTMSVQSGGVTIGATSVPAAKLDVNGALKAQRFFSRNGSFSSTSGNWHNVVDLQQSEYENRTLICSVYTNGTHSYSSATVNVAYNGGNFVLTLGNKISSGSTDIRISGAYLQFYTPWTTTGNFWRITIN